MKSDGGQKDQRKQEVPLGVDETLWCGVRRLRTWLLPWQDGFQVGEESGFVSSSQQ